MARVPPHRVSHALQRGVEVDEHLLFLGTGVLVYARLVHVEDERGVDVVDERGRRCHVVGNIPVLHPHPGLLLWISDNRLRGLASQQRLLESVFGNFLMSVCHKPRNDVRQGEGLFTSDSFVDPLTNSVKVALIKGADSPLEPVTVVAAPQDVADDRVVLQAEEAGNLRVRDGKQGELLCREELLGVEHLLAEGVAGAEASVVGKEAKAGRASSFVFIWSNATAGAIEAG